MAYNKKYVDPNWIYNKKVDEENSIKQAEQIVKKATKKQPKQTLIQELNTGSFNSSDVQERNGYQGKKLRFINRATAGRLLNQHFNHCWSMSILSITPIMKDNEINGYSAIVRIKVDHPKLKREIEEIGESSTTQLVAVTSAMKRASSFLIPYFLELWND